MTTITKAPAPQPLQAAKLCKHYGKQQVLQDLDLTFEPGRIYGLIGRNGAGKTTLLGILSGQNFATGGQALYGGQPVWENSAVLGNLHFARELSASSELAGLSVKNFLRAGRLFCPYWDQNYAEELIKKFELPNKMINRLSRGQMSMVSITAALASRAPVTLLDEPTASCIYTQKGNKKIRKPQAANQTALIFARCAAARLLSINSIRRLCWS